MIFKCISIAHFKGFFEKQTFIFAAPNGSPGSGLNLIVGENNSGKTTLFDVIRKFNYATNDVRKEERHSEGGFYLEVETDLGVSIATPLDGGAQIEFAMKGISHGEFQLGYELIHSRRNWSHRFNGYSNYQDYVQGKNGSERDGTVDSQLGQLLASVAAEKKDKGRLTNLLKTVVPHFSDWHIDADENGKFIEYRSSAGHTHKENLFGDGIVSLFRILSHILFEDKQKALLIDEPELSIHPQAQKRLAQVLSESAKNRQIVISTHSPYFVRWRDILNGAAIIRVIKTNDKKCAANSVPTGAAYLTKIASQSTSWQKPQLLDEVAKELFFTDKVLFVEGQEDVGLIRDYCEQKGIPMNFEIFGYGSGGFGNIQYFLELSEALGIQSAALYDGDKSSEAAKSKARFTKALVECLPQEDIRDKVDAKTKQVLTPGIFDQDGKMKSTGEADFVALIRRLNTYFK